MIKLIKKKEAARRKIARSYDVWSLPAGATGRKLSIALGKAVKHSEKCLNKKSDRIYYVLRGRLKIKPANGKRWLAAGPGDAVFIRAGTWYHFTGTFTALLVNSPPFDLKNEPAKYNFVME